MFKNDYHTVMDKFSPDETLIRHTIEQAETADKPISHRVIPLRKRLIPAVAAVLVLAVALTVLLIPHTPQHSFTLTASAAENTPLRDSSYVEVGVLNWVSGSYTYDHVGDEFMTDITVNGEDIADVTYRMNSGKLGLLDSSARLTDYTGKEDAVYHNNGYFDAEGYSYYDSVTCAYSDRFTAEDGLCITVQGGVGGDFDAKTVLRYLGVEARLMDVRVNLEPLTVTQDEVYSANYDYFNEVLKDARLLITATYIDGTTETQAVSFRADCEITPVHRRFYAYAYDEDGNPYPVHSFGDALYSFELRDEFNWDESEDYNKVKHIFSEDDLIEFDDYETNVILSAKLES